ncbi:MAG: exonuclease domain-containing protein [Caldiserica bacterium]|nr:exonuclease domain-containing protein [Caldisericota bacterium]
MKNEQELVFFDLETTGLDQTSDQIIEIGAVKVRGGKEVGRFEQFCRLKEGARLPEFISALTGISPLDLEPAEPVDQVVDEFLQFAGGSPLLAHNSSFDEGFLRRALHGQLANPVFDTLELARIFFPDLQSHSLVALVDSLEIKKEEAHRALGDSLSLFRFYRKLKDKIAQSALPDAIVQRIQFLYPVVADLGLLDTGDTRTVTQPGDMAVLQTVLTDLDRSRLPRLKALKPGVVGDMPSPEQALLAAGRDVLLQCEPRSLRARYLGDIQASASPVAVLLRAPAAIEPLLEDTLPGDARPLWISQESPNNLVCLMLLDGATRSPAMRREFGFELSALIVYEWETRSVFIPGMPLFLKKSRLISHISAAHCQLEPSCPFHGVCPVRESLARARTAHLHVTDLAEAPHVFRELGESASVLVSSPETEKLMSDVIDVPEVQVTSIMLRIIAGVAGERAEVPGLAIVADLAERARTLLEELYVNVTHQENAGVRGRIAIGETLWSAGEFAALRSTADTMVAAFANVGEALPPTMRMAYLTQCQDLASVLDNADNPAYAVWMERQGQEITLASTRTVLATRIRACSTHAQFFLAGTSVCPSGDQRFLPETFGLAGPDPAAVIVDSEPDGPRVPTFVTLHLPKPNESGFEKGGARLIAETMRRFPGKAMVASNSLETLRRLQSFLAREPGLSEYVLLLPKNGHTRTELLEQFSGQSRAILLIPFDYLSFGDIVSAKFLFVTKLQFPNSFLPTVTRLKQAVKEKRGDPFRQFDLPYALTLLGYTLHQMDPQTLRTVFMLDNRSFSTAYADRIRTVLPTPSLFLPMENQESLLQHLDRWIRNQTL